ncbi:hypothetical protein TRFO_19675 [Tritrichomonas foetus]|uniref:Uncharacterized protein n=1 Tax=Tritrichomonas foetus TaxID=1144522 RepID=A0A1J4KIJ4_9EUKA|nr:hypothetical protein TRFO_19675 [Tritrichomonas foetus]|eukprot:OHT10882.1 hypothetical protein TRFO_19675 [Tritrichomonas foetus]
MKSAIDLAIRSKPPVIKPIPGDILNLPGNLVSLVVTNWLGIQLRKPPPKAPAKRLTQQRKGGKTVNVEPPPPEPELQGPFLVFITDYPRTVEQFQDVLAQQAPIYCHLTIDGGPPVTDKKNSAAVNPATNFENDLKEVLSSEMKFFTIKISSETPMEQQLMEIIQQIHSVYNGYVEYRREFVDTCYITLPTYPKEPILFPLLPAEKPQKSTRDSGRGSISLAGLASSQPQNPIVATDALNAAYKSMILSEIESFIRTSAQPCFSTHFQHYAEIFPAFPLPASLAQVLAIRPNSKAKEIFLMRRAADRNNVPYDTIFRVHIRKKFEEMIGYSIGERNQKEYLAFEILPNVIAPLSEQFSEFKMAEFGGKILLAFYHKIPEDLPILERHDTYELPTYVGFGKWFDEHGPFTHEVKDIKIPKDVGVSTGGSSLFMGMESDQTTSIATHYFCESGLRVVTYQPKTENGMLEDLHFHLSYCQNERFAFKMSQRPSPTTGEEEEEDSVETLTSIRGVLSKNTEFYFDHSSDKANFIMTYKNTRVEFDILKHICIISGIEGESHRIITPDGKLIKYCPNPIIYHSDGTIATKIRDKWKMVDSEGIGYVKRDGKWLLEPKFNETSTTISTYFTSRKVTNRSDGLSTIDDNGEITLIFPDETKYNMKTHTFYHSKIPSVSVNERVITIDSKEFTAEFANNCDCSFTLKNQDCTISFNEDLRHLLIQYGQFCNVMTIVDLLTGNIAHVGARRFVYYLTEDWKWNLGRQLCSKKDMLQHFQDGDFIDRIQAIEKVDKEEIETIITNGHKPRLFIVEKDFNDFNVFELLDDSVYKTIADQAINQPKKNTEKDLTLWFNTKPKSFREIKILPKITSEMAKQAEEVVQKENEIQINQKVARISAIDPKWRVAEAQQLKEEEEMINLYQKYGIDQNFDVKTVSINITDNQIFEEEEEEANDEYLEEEEYSS